MTADRTITFDPANRDLCERLARGSASALGSSVTRLR